MRASHIAHIPTEFSRVTDNLRTNESVLRAFLVFKQNRGSTWVLCCPVVEPEGRPARCEETFPCGPLQVQFHFNDFPRYLSAAMPQRFALCRKRQIRPSDPSCSRTRFTLRRNPSDAGKNEQDQSTNPTAETKRFPKVHSNHNTAPNQERGQSIEHAHTIEKNKW